MASNGQSTRVFISHSHLATDKELVRDIARRLREAGIEPIQLKGKAAPGARGFGALRQAIEESNVVLFLMTPSALETKWPLVELGGAQALGKDVLLVVAGVKRSQLPVPFNDYQPVPFDRLDRSIEKLTRKSAKVR